MLILNSVYRKLLWKIAIRLYQLPLDLENQSSRNLLLMRLQGLLSMDK